MKNFITTRQYVVKLNCATVDSGCVPNFIKNLSVISACCLVVLQEYFVI